MRFAPLCGGSWNCCYCALSEDVQVIDGLRKQAIVASTALSLHHHLDLYFIFSLRYNLRVEGGLIQFMDGFMTKWIRRAVLLPVLCMINLAQGCAGTYGKVVRQYREAPVCCTSMAELPIEPLLPGGATSFNLDAGSPAYRFATGKSYFRAFSLPQGPYPYRVTVSSYLIGDYLKTAYLFAPQLVTLDEQRHVVRSTGPGTFSITRTSFMEALQTAGDFPYKIEGGLTFNDQNRDERYLVVMTTDELLRQKTPFPAKELPMLILGSSGTSSSRPNEVEVIHAPGGKVSISVAAQGTEDPAAQSVDTASVSEKAVSGAGSEAVAASKPASVAGTKTPSNRPEIVIVRLANGKAFGAVELGRTNLGEARRLFENSAAGLGPERSNGATFTVGSVSLMPKHLFTPPGTMYQLYFDDNGVLVIIVDGAATNLPASGKDFRQRFLEARETWHSVSSYELQASLGSCVTLIAVFRTVNDSLDSAAFGYGCPTK